MPCEARSGTWHPVSVCTFVEGTGDAHMEASHQETKQDKHTEQSWRRQCNCAISGRPPPLQSGEGQADPPWLERTVSRL